MIDISKAKPYVSADLISDYFSLQDILELSANKEEVKEEDKKSENEQKEDEDDDEKLFLLPSEPLPLDSLALANADLKVKMNDIVVVGTDKRAAANLTASLKDSVLKTSFDFKESFDTDGNQKTVESLSGTIDLNAVKPESSEITAKIDGKDIVVEEFLQKFVNERFKGGVLNLSANLKTFGNNVHQFASNLNGNTTVLLENAFMSNHIAMVIGGDILGQILDLLKVPFNNDDENLVDMQCAVVNLNFKDGLASFDKKIAIETSKMHATVSGDLNLGTERMDLSLAIDTQSGLKLGLLDTLANLIKVKGTFSEPSVGISAMGTATTAATIGAAIMTGGLSFAGQAAVDMAVPTISPCSKALGRPVASSKVNAGKAKSKETKSVSKPAADEEKANEAEKTPEQKKAEQAKQLFKGIADAIINKQ